MKKKKKKRKKIAVYYSGQKGSNLNSQTRDFDSINVGFGGF